jgi:hypothetical protein
MFVVRVELKDVPSHSAREVYDTFHKSMEKAAFARKIKGGNNKWYKLPDATYVSSSIDDKAKILVQVQTLATAAGYKSGVIVFKYDGESTWNGLEEILIPPLFANA